MHLQGRRSCTVPFKTAPCSLFVYLFFFKEKENEFGSDPKMGYDSCPTLYNAYGAKTLRSKLVKKTKGKKMICYLGQPAHICSQWSIFRGDQPTLILVYFQGRPAIHTHTGLFSRATYPHKLTHFGLFSWATYPSILKVVYFQGRPAHTLTLTLVYFYGRPTQVEKGRVVSL